MAGPLLRRAAAVATATLSLPELGLAIHPQAPSINNDACETDPLGETCAAKASASPRAAKGLVMLQRPGSKVGRTPDAGDLSLADRASFTASVGSSSVTVVSYNLYWWNVGQNNRWNDLYGRIRDEKPFGLIGFQECNDVSAVVQAANLDGWGFFQGPSPNPCPIAWNSETYDVVGEPAFKWVAEDQWGSRWMTWVRLEHRATKTHVFFANTHGPLGNCGSALGNGWLTGVTENAKDGDVMFFTGDFNCGTGSTAMNIIKGYLKGGVDGGIDQILTNQDTLSGETKNGWPSDHPLIKGSFGVEASGDAGADPSPNPAPTPAPSPTSGCGQMEENVDFWGNDLAETWAASASACADQCRDNSACKSWSFAPAWKGCYLKSAEGAGRKTDSCCTSGTPSCSADGAGSGDAADEDSSDDSGNDDAGSDDTGSTCGVTEENYDYFGSDLAAVQGANAADCAEKCRTRSGCKSYTYLKSLSRCYLKTSAQPGRKQDSCCTSGLPACASGSSGSSAGTAPSGTGFQRHQGTNCYYQNGADSLPGKDMIGQKSLAACKAECQQESQCTGIVVLRNEDPGNCWLRMNIDFSKCRTSTDFDLWTKA